MDKNSFFIGIICIFSAFGLMIWQSSQLRDNIAVTQIVSGDFEAKELQAVVDDIGVEIPEKFEKEKEESTFEGQQFVFLENEDLRVRLNTVGAGIQDVEIKKYPAIKGEAKPFIFNEGVQLPALTLSLGASEKFLLVNYEIATQTAEHVIFKKTMKSGITIEREYKLSSEEIPYILSTSTRFLNTTDKAFDLGDIFIGLGSFPATASDVLGDYLNFGYYDGSTAHFIKVNDFRASNGFLGMGKGSAKKQISGEDKMVWGSVKNQFFTGVFTPKVPGCGFVAMPKEILDVSTGKMNETVVGSVKISVGCVAAGKSKLVDGKFYVGPKDYVLLDRLGNNQDLVMQFGIFGFVSKILLLLMKGIHSLVNNWGVTIIILTMIVKLILWPLTTAQVRSSRKMSKLQEPMKKLKEKYRDNPQKMQSETLKLFRDNRVNPAAGCLPVFVQIPIFLGLYFMLRTTAEMRFAPFLWISDLSLPDTIAHIGSFPVNLLPLIMGTSMFWQMKVMPTPSIEGAQKWVIKIMPAIFLLFCYNFPAALVLYWTVQNLLTILQQVILNKKPDGALFIEDSNATKKRKI